MALTDAQQTKIVQLARDLVQNGLLLYGVQLCEAAGMHRWSEVTPFFSYRTCYTCQAVYIPENDLVTGRGDVVLVSRRHLGELAKQLEQIGNDIYEKHTGVLEPLEAVEAALEKYARKS